MTHPSTLTIDIDPQQTGLFLPLFGAGVGIKARAGMPLAELLCDRLAIPPVYIDQRVQTIFVNGRAVDRMEQVSLAAGSAVALSAAMPGLAGATFRKGGILSGFRKDISHHVRRTPDKDAGGTMFTLKLFNMVAEEVGPWLLHRGVWLKGETLRTHLRQRSLRPTEFKSLLWNDTPLNPDQLPSRLETEEWIGMVVRPIGDSGLRLPVPPPAAADRRPG